MLGPGRGAEAAADPPRPPTPPLEVEGPTPFAPAKPLLSSVVELAHLGPQLMKGIQDELNVTSISTPHLLPHLISARENILCAEG